MFFRGFVYLRVSNELSGARKGGLGDIRWIRWFFLIDRWMAMKMV